MNEQTEKLIRELAERLGTTVDHLWGVLIRQARIGGAVDLIVVVLWCALLVWGYKRVSRKTQTFRENFDLEVLAWVWWSIATVITMVVVGVNLSNIIGAFLNPEYWALKQVLVK